MPAEGWTELEPLCHAPTIGHVATTAPDGSPHVVPIWLDADGVAGQILLNTTEGTAKLRNVRHDPRVALSIHASDEPFLAFTVLGHVVGEVTGEAAAAHIDALSRAYDGKPWSYPADERDRRVILRVVPDRVVRMA